MKAKINRNEFLEMVADALPAFGDTSGDFEPAKKLSPEDVRKIYDVVVDLMKDVVCSGKDLSLTGFGSFTLKNHKGHPVQFEASGESVEDYVVLKFTASDVLMNDIRNAHKKGSAKVSKKK